MSDINNQDSKAKAVPFFARYLEGQNIEELSDPEMEAINSGSCGVMTLKFPSDQEDGVTKKYPSDSDEAVTQKFPSDNEDGTYK